MKDHRRSWLFAGALGMALAGCTSERAAPSAEPPVVDDGAPGPASVQAAASAPASAAPAAASTATAADAAPMPEPAREPAADEVSPDAVAEPDEPAAFNVASVPQTSASLPPFPFFKAPDGLVSGYREGERELSFDAQYFIAGTQPRLVEGRVFRDRFNLAGDARKYSELEFHRNYENAVKALGGVKVNKAQYTPGVAGAAGGRASIEKHMHGAAAISDYRHDSYLIRAPAHEYWIDVSTGSIPLHGYVVVVEREAMTQSLGFLDAAAMKQAIDRDGRVALHVNFDVDKATLRPEAEPVIAEIRTLMEANPSLELSIEGHTDNTGDADHNHTLSAQRARAVASALVALGVAPGRLQSQGFGQDRPVADNATPEGRAQNRRVELVRL
ncbi:OmpA family protein [Luteimonas soli]|uniref:OmpA family protein n=1 Tax=Luteimonas soli TaxID=1648966 RepID=A0ABV7XEI2_9GAMM